MIEVPHLSWPFALTQGADVAGQVPHAPLSQVEQDTLAEVQQSIQLLLSTRPGDRPLAPDVGVEDFVFTPHGIDPQLLAARLTDMEPRAALSIEVVGPGGDGRQDVRIRVGLAQDQETP